MVLLKYMVMSKHLFWILVAVFLFLVVGVTIFVENRDSDNKIKEPVACTLDAKICPDGSSVGRIPPDCEFATCPAEIFEEPIGGQRDEYGCLGPAGYTFDESIGACIRSWEMDSEEKATAAQIAVGYVAFEKGLTVIDVEVFKCPGCFDVSLDQEGERMSVSLRDWEVSSVNNSKPQIPDDKNDNGSVLIESDFGTKIVYGTSQSVDTAPLIKDCEARGGVFNTCGNPCGPEAEMCITVCAFTCEDII
ncbi:MAG: hypothetical protein KAR24_00615 [Candidatus Pacebacteria bacterium]|nr:hypothetical protein [Candidatus Paceibacterota bacterium]MCK5591370.1 hypothetical protein [Candidatus Paceibacterota bacterium]